LDNWCSQSGCHRASERDDDIGMEASSASASLSARTHDGRGVDDTADAATAARWLEGAFFSVAREERFGCRFLDFRFSDVNDDDAAVTRGAGGIEREVRD